MAEYIEREALRDSVESIDWYSVYRGKLTTGANSENALYNANDIYSAIDNAPAADVAPVRHGRWIMKHKHRGGFRRYTGIDDMGEPHTITVDERVEYDDRYCSECGKQSADNFLNYCPNCGAKMDLEAT